MTIKDLEPKLVWKYFYELTQIPRPSKKEEKVIAYLEQFAQEHKLEYKKDKVGNIVIKKPATKGLENRKTVVLQSHVDMVCEKNSDKAFDFDNDPIETVVDGDWLRANGTTLGADNGVGCAAELALLASEDIPHGPLECLFTVDEETGMTGAMNLEPGFFDAKILLNLDSEDEGELYIGCAGGMGVTAQFAYKREALPSGFLSFKISVSGLKGGHSGGEIHVGLGNANKILTRALYRLSKESDWRLLDIQGGNLHNAIPREAYAVVAIPAAAKEQLAVIVNELQADVKEELKKVDPNVSLKLESVSCDTQAIEHEVARKLVLALYACPHGVLGMSHEIPDLVETSNNLASVKTTEQYIVVGTSQRSSTASLRDSTAEMVTAVFELAGAKVEARDPYPGWKPNSDSEILKVAAESYKRLFGKEAKVKAIHAGLECGLILDVYPGLDMVSFGPTLRDVHSPMERIEIATVDLWWKHLLDVLKNIPVA